MKTIYPEEAFADMRQLGFEDELYGRLDEAEKKFKAQFDAYKDYDGTFRILRSFYIRRGERKKYEALLDEVAANPPGEMYRQPDFFVNRIISEIRDWRDPWSAIRLYYQYYDQIKESAFLRKQTEETLKVFAADYTDCDDRVAWNRQQLTKAPKYTRYDVYRLILRLYLGNSRYREADEVVREMRREGVPQMEGLDRLVQVCLRKQDRKFYVGGKQSCRSDTAYLNRLLWEARSHNRYTETAFAAEGANVILTMAQFFCVFRESRQTELAKIGKIHLMYAGLIGLHNSLWSREDAFLRMVLQWIDQAENVCLSAPDFRAVCKAALHEPNLYRKAEEMQFRLYCQAHPDFIVL